MVCENCKYNNNCNKQDKFDKGFKELIKTFNIYFNIYDGFEFSLKCKDFNKEKNKGRLKL